MKYLSYLLVVLVAIEQGQLSFRLGAFNVSVLVAPGAPQHLTIAAGLLALEKALTGSAGTFTSGDVTIVLTEIAA